MPNTDYPSSGFPLSPAIPSDYTCAEHYTVRSGDTLYAISQTYGVSVAALMQVNRILNPYALKIGQQICIPQASVTAESEAETEIETTPDALFTYHTIQSGDTLYMIAKQYNVPLGEIMRINPDMDPYNLRVGMEIRIPVLPENEANEEYPAPGQTPAPMPMPEPAPMPMPEPMPMPTPDPAPMPTPVEPVPLPDTYCRMGANAYVAQRGDTLTRLMERFSVNYGELMCYNPDVDFEAPLEGITLCIPLQNDEESCPLSDSYFVKSGDTLDTISQKLLIVTDSLLMANPSLTVTDFAVPGTRICVPK